MREELMNEELNSRFQELSADFAAEFDLARGLDRLRAVGRGIRTKAEGDHPGTEQKELSSDISPSAMTHLSAREHSLGEAIDDAMVSSSVAVLEGMLISDNVVQIDLAKLEGAPTHRSAIVVLEGEHLQRSVLTATAPQTEPTAIKSAAADAITSITPAAAAVALAGVGIAAHLSSIYVVSLALISYLATLATALYFRRTHRQL
jgi:hypothetical protein